MTPEISGIGAGSSGAGAFLDVLARGVHLKAKARSALFLAIVSPIAFLHPVLNASAQTAAGPLTEEEKEKEILKSTLRELSRAQGAKGGGQFCAIAISSQGTLSISPEASELSSMYFGGTPGQAEILTSNSSFSLSMDIPAGFSLAPVGGNDSTVIRASYSGFGDTNFSETPGNLPISLKKGATSIRANMIATRTGDVFPAGQYRAVLTLRCE